LSKEELLRLLLLANGYDMVLCMEECAEALCPFDGYDEALAFLRAVPDMLLQTKPLHAARKAAGDALAKALGPVEKLWRPGEVHNHNDWLDSYVLDERVTALPIGGIEALLRSEELQLKSENYTASLAMWWALGQEEHEKEVQQLLFNRLLRSFRYTRMSSTFLASLADNSWVTDSGLLHDIMRRTIWRRDFVLRVYSPEFPASRVKGCDRYKYSMTFTTYFTKAAVEALREPDDRLSMPLGLLNGFPCYLDLIMRADGQYSLCIFSELFVEEDDLNTLEEAEWGGQDGDAWRCFDFKIVRGTFGEVALEEDQTYVSYVNSADFILVCSSEALVYDAEGKLKVELELTIEQHYNC
jgi:hypothetical protein